MWNKMGYEGVLTYNTYIVYLCYINVSYEDKVYQRLTYGILQRTYVDGVNDRMFL